MIFDKKPPLNILTCPVCHSLGSVGLRRCKECHGLALGHFVRNRFLFWGYPLTRYHLSLTRGRRILARVRWITVAILFLNCWLWAAVFSYQRGLFAYLSPEKFNWRLFAAGAHGEITLLFCSGVILLLYLWYRFVREHEFKGVVEHFDYKFLTAESADEKEVAFTDWARVLRLPARRRRNIADAFTDEALKVLGDAYRLADKNRDAMVAPAHLFAALLNSNRVANIFIRLGLPVNYLRQTVDTALERLPKTNAGVKLAMPLISPDFAQILFDAYEEAYGAHQEYVSVTELLSATVRQSEILQEKLFDFNISPQKLTNVVEWARIRERLYRQYEKFRRAAGHRSKKGMDKAMTALGTPYLNKFSEDITALAQFGRLETCVAREREIEEIFRVVQGGGKNVILVGDHGVGKRSIVEGVAEKMIADDCPARLRDKRLVRLSVSALLSGTTPAGALERLQNIFYEISRAGNVVLFIHNIHELAGVSAGGDKNSLDVADTLAEHLTRGRFLTIATTTTADFSKRINDSSLGNMFTKVEVREMNENQAIQVLESKVGYEEYKHKIFFSYDALEKAVQLCARFVHDTFLPGSALEVMSEAAAHTFNKKGANTLVTGEEVAEVVAQKTSVPVTTVTADESSKLLRLEEEMHKRVIGQEEAVDLVANALRRARAEVRATTRPIASFLFLGPTGVGKTELAKTIAAVYFGGENRMIRLDMSEYQDKTSMNRLIGAPGEQGSGLLTEAVRRTPFALILLDEIEKADKDVLNLFLQVMDDGRLTDSTGRVADFTNVIIIATSNAGTAFVEDEMRAGRSTEAIKERLLHGSLREYFRPEFLNRFDGIVLFKSLARADIKKIAGLMLQKVGKNLEEKGILFEIEPAALEFLADIGFDPEFGARPMRRAIQERVENKLAELLLSGKLRRRNTATIKAEGKIEVK